MILSNKKEYHERKVIVSHNFALHPPPLCAWFYGNDYKDIIIGKIMKEKWIKLIDQIEETNNKKEIEITNAFSQMKKDCLEMIQVVSHLKDNESVFVNIKDMSMNFYENKVIFHYYCWNENQKFKLTKKSEYPKRRTFNFDYDRCHEDFDEFILNWKNIVTEVEEKFQEKINDYLTFQ